MLTKLLGCVLILMSCTGIGFSKSADMRKQIEELETLRHIFSLLKGELEYTHGTFGEMFLSVGNKISGQYGTWITNLGKTLEQKPQSQFETIWKESIDVSLKDIRLFERDRKELERMGRHLGRLESVELYIKQLEYEIKIRREEYRSKRKLCQSMGIMSGIFLVILLL